MRSIQTRLTLLIVLGTAIIVMLVGLAMDYLLAKQLASDFDRNLLSKAMTLVSLTEQDQGVVEFDFSDEFMPEFSAQDNPEYFRLWLHDGGVVARSPSLGDRDLPRAGATIGAPSFLHMTLPDGRPGRLVEVMFVPLVDEEDEDDDDKVPTAVGGASVSEPGAPRIHSASIALARGTETLQTLLGDARTLLLIALLSLMAGLAVLARVAVGHGLKPLKRITREVRALDADKLHLRLSDADSEELAPITAQLNQLLERLEDAFQREKRFSGNVAHELRTPIAELRALSEVGRGWPAERDMVEGFFGDLVDLADDMEQTVTNLLMLTRLDAGNQIVTREPINLAHLIAKLWGRLRATADDRNIVLVTEVEPTLNVNTDKDKLQLILINILSNALNYSPSDSSILVETRENEAGIELAVSNTAIDLEERDLPLLFERFWRKDHARTGGQHAGLGLSLVKGLADLLDIRVAALLREPNQFTVSVSNLSVA